MVQDENENTALHNLASDGYIESIEVLLALYPETQHLQIVDMINECVALCIVEQQALNVTDNDGRTVLQLAKSSVTRNFIRKLVGSGHASSCTVL